MEANRLIGDIKLQHSIVFHTKELHWPKSGGLYISWQVFYEEDCCIMLGEIITMRQNSLHSICHLFREF